MVQEPITEERGQRILVIDDDTTQRILVKEYLEEAGYTVRLSDDGSRGLKMASKFKPDLIILDWMLPSLDGYTLCKCLKEGEVTSEIPIILITASRDRDVIERGLSAGADDFVTKPVDWVFLADRVANVLEKTRQQTEITRQLQSVKRNEEDTARLIASQTEQLSASFEQRMQAVEDAAAREIEEVRTTMTAELEAARSEVLKALAEAEQARVELEQMREEAESLLAERDGWKNQAELAMAQNSAENETLSVELASVKADVSRKLQEVKTAALAERDALEEAHAKEISRLEAQVKSKVSAALGIAQAERDEVRSTYESKLTSCWHLAHVASTHHRDLAFRMMDAMATLATDPAFTGAHHGALTALDELQNLARSLTDSVGSLNLLAQVMAGKAELKENVFDLGQLVGDAAAKFNSVCAQRRIAITSRVPRGKVLVHGDQARLTYALASLLINATRFTPQGGAIKLSMDERPDGSVEVAVADTGVGVAPAQLDSLRTCLDRPMAAIIQEGGSVGYGIPIATALVRQHGGQLEIDSGPGQGTVARIVVPKSRRASPLDNSDHSQFRNVS